jgi:hypothetical protein
MKEIISLKGAESETLDERQTVNEMGVVCSKKDGYGMIIEVYSEDHGVLGDKSRPAHAHLKTADNKYLGKFAITDQPPRADRYVFDCDKNKFIPPEYKEKIVKWARMKYQNYGVSNWAALKVLWNSLHP